MFKRCKHNWEIYSQIYYPPRGGKAWGMSSDFYEMLYLGATVSGLRCSLCGNIKSQTDVGDIRV